MKRTPTSRMQTPRRTAQRSESFTRSSRSCSTRFPMNPTNASLSGVCDPGSACVTAMGDAPPAYNAGRYKSGCFEASGGAGEVNETEIHGANDEEYCDDEASDGAEEVNDQTIDGAHDDENSDDEASGGAGEVDDQTLDGAHDDAQEFQGVDDGQPPGHDGNVLADDEHDVALPEHQQEPPKTPVRQLTGANPDKSPASSDLFVTPFPWENMPEGQALIRVR